MWLPEKLEKQIGFMKKNNYVFTYHQYRHFASRDKVGKIVNIPLKLGYKEALKGNSMGCLTVCLDKSKIKPFLKPGNIIFMQMRWQHQSVIIRVSHYQSTHQAGRYSPGSDA